MSTACWRGIVYVVRNGLQWKDAPRAYGPHKTLYNHFVRWSRLGVFANIFAALAAEPGEPDRLMIDATHLNPKFSSMRCRETGSGRRLWTACPLLLRRSGNECRARTVRSVRVSENEHLLFGHLVHCRADTADAVPGLAAPGERHPVSAERGVVVDHDRRGIQPLGRPQGRTDIG